jgi:hypothetical protein
MITERSTFFRFCLVSRGNDKRLWLCDRQGQREASIIRFAQLHGLHVFPEFSILFGCFAAIRLLLSSSSEGGAIILASASSSDMSSSAASCNAAMLPHLEAQRRGLELRVLLPAQPPPPLVLREPEARRRGKVLRVLLPAQPPPPLVLREPEAQR